MLTSSNSNWLQAGTVISPHGITGEFKLRPVCDSAEFLLNRKHFAYLENGVLKEAASVSSRVHQNHLLLKLEGVDTRTKAQAFIKRMIYFDKNEKPLSEGRHFVADLIGLAVFNEDGAEIGVLSDVFQTPAHDVYIVKTTDGEEKLIPAVPAFIKEISAEGKRITVSLIEGM